jgi:LmbE family N-acetylglucosaminyl deacetylase
MSSVAGRGILCVFAHPDDESFCGAGTMARYASAGLPVDLLTFEARADAGQVQEPELARVRREAVEQQG